MKCLYVFELILIKFWVFFVGHLVSHRRSHSTERPHACSQCGKTFVEKGNMLRHMKKHLLDANFVQPPPKFVAPPTSKCFFFHSEAFPY